jgi:hypothetical protein
MGYEERNKEIERKTLMAYAERMLGDPVPFGSRDTGCPKCGRSKQERRCNYCPGYQPLLEMDQPCKRNGEHLHINCECGFSWIEWCKDDTNVPSDMTAGLILPG